MNGWDYRHGGARCRLAALMRRWADRLDYDGAPKAMGYSFTFERNEGIRFREGNSKGCRLWYLGGGAEHDKAHTDAENPAPWVDWATGTVKRF